MTLRNLFWFIFVLAVLLYGWAWWPLAAPAAIGLIVFVLIGILGWRTFGPTISG